MSDSFRASLIRWLPTVTLGSVLVLLEASGIDVTLGAVFVVAFIQAVWVGVPMAARGVGKWVGSLRNDSTAE